VIFLEEWERKTNINAHGWAMLSYIYSLIPSKLSKSASIMDRLLNTAINDGDDRGKSTGARPSVILWLDDYENTIPQ